MIGNAKKLGIFISLIVLMMGNASAQPASPHTIRGYVSIGGILVPTSTPVTVNISGDISGYSVAGPTSGSAAGFYQLVLPVGNSFLTTGFNTSDTLTYRVGSTIATTTNCPTGVTAGLLSPSCNLSIAASCTDGIQNGAELITDCGGGACGSCMAVGSTVTLTATKSESSTQYATGTFTISSASTSSSTPSIPVVISSPANLVNAANSSDTIAIAVNDTGLTLTYGASNIVLVNATIAANQSGTFTGTINVTTTNANLTNSTTTITLTVSVPSVGRRPLRYLEVTITGVDREETCVNEPVLVSVIGEKYGRAQKRADIDVFFGGKKILYNLKSDEEGNVQFTPTKEGEYMVEVEKTGFRQVETEIDVTDCDAIATTTLEAPPETSTTVEAPETSTTVEAPKTTTSVAPRPATTVAPRPTTTVAPPAAGKGFPWIAVVVVVVIIVVVLVLLMKKGGSGEAAEEAPKEDKPPEEEKPPKEDKPPEEEKPPKEE